MATDPLKISQAAMVNADAIKKVRFKPPDPQASEISEMAVDANDGPQKEAPPSYAFVLSGESGWGSSRYKFSAMDDEYRTSQPYSTSVIAWIWFPGLPEYIYKKKILYGIGSLVGKVAKLDFHKTTTNRRRFARVAMYVYLKEPLASQVVIGDRIQVIEYENFPHICYSCGRFGHLKEARPHDSQSQPQPMYNFTQTNQTSALPGSKPSLSDDDPYGPWMVVPKCRRRPQVETAKKSKISKSSKGTGSRLER
ncbi:hypothetical protein F3Y22_tig00111356pilonHSYRG00148 [Hibiscus syriacus]|uniref:Uncharacterized protein n=1 Tax=Hibiscus syriacus TaxID=106335 RepID=A0A6A2YNP7_HIBSY|nr:hypothetical protein F3Y22_tig00111356pilonHSYRG00148 [Hibiscus syriacus]